MKKAKLEMGWRWNVAVGHDDVLMAALLVGSQRNKSPHRLLSTFAEKTSS